MDYSQIAKTIIALKNNDLEFRKKLIKRGQLGKGYNKEMAQIHNHNATILNEIIDEIGYPTEQNVGKEANDAAWLIIQHAIGQPNFMKKCSRLLEVAERKHKTSSKKLAYLTDRIAVFENKPQRYGTQFDWDQNGELNPNRFDDLEKVNKRRKSIGLNSIEEQTELIRQQAKNNNEEPPNDFEERKQEIETWKRTVGWIT
ncbi:MAG TPA: hypothetical protein DCS22_00075 [Flavobacteriaceae bacterium]|nr:hypothetical protein [Flavobacteriaceae bacterium]